VHKSGRKTSIIISSSNKVAVNSNIYIYAKNEFSSFISLLMDSFVIVYKKQKNQRLGFFRNLILTIVCHFRLSAA